MSQCYASTLISLCRQEKGYREKKTNSQLEDKTANAGSNNWNKYADYIDKNMPNFYNGPKNGYPWCDVYVDCMFLRAFGYEDALRLLCQPEKSCGAGVDFSYNYYKAQGRASNSPKLGAQIFFWNGSTMQHTGIVVDMTADKILVSEGNSSDGVNENWYTKTDSTIYGYGIPAYDPEPSVAGNITIDGTKYSEIIIKNK